MKLTDYIRGERHGRGAQGIELDAMRDPLLGEALDGFDAVPGDHAAALERLAESIRESAAEGRAAARARSEMLRERRVRGWSVAAAAVFIAGVVGTGAWLLRDGLPEGSRRSPLAQRNDYYTGHPEAFLPPVTVIPNEERRDTLRDDERREEELAVLAPIVRVPNNPAQATDIAVNLDEMETAEVARVVTQEDSKAVADEDPSASEGPVVRIRGMSTVSVTPPDTMPDTTSQKIVDRLLANAATGGRTVEGQVVDAATGEPLVGVFIHADGKKSGVVTDGEGRFVLPVESEGAKMVADYLGYERVISVVDDPEEAVLIAMAEDRTTLEEVVVIGYGSQRKAAYTGSVSGVDASGRARGATTREDVREAVRDTAQTDTFRAYARGVLIFRSAVLGRVKLSFRVDADGRPRGIRVIESPSPDASRSARDLLKNGPDWPVEPARKLITIDL